MRRTVGTKVARKDLLEPPTQALACLVVRELHAHPRRLAALRARRGGQDHAPATGWRVGSSHQLQQFEHLVPRL